MIRIVTLSGSKNRVGSTARMQELTEQLRIAEIDVLCCQGMRRTLDGSEDQVGKIAESLQMTYSFSATSCGAGTRGGGSANIITGLSILAGAHVWMLNSGSFPLPGEETGKKQMAQYAVIRKKGDSLLVINAELSADASAQLLQLQAIFSHPLLQEHYGAVALCSNGNTAVSPRHLRSATALSPYKLTTETTATASNGETVSSVVSVDDPGNLEQMIDGVIFTLIERKLAPAMIKTHGSFLALKPASILAAEFELNHIPPEKRHKFFFPLSFTEQRLELRES